MRITKVNMGNIVEQVKIEILEDIAYGILPDNVGTFGDLHDYVDANEYGGFCDPVNPNSTLSHEDMNYIQDQVHQWLVQRGGDKILANREGR